MWLFENYYLFYHILYEFIWISRYKMFKMFYLKSINKITKFFANYEVWKCSLQRVKEYTRVQNNKILISRFMCEDHGRGVIGGGLISGKKFTRRELLFKFATTVAVTPRRHVIRITTTIISLASSSTNTCMCLTGEPIKEPFHACFWTNLIPIPRHFENRNQRVSRDWNAISMCEYEWRNDSTPNKYDNVATNKFAEYVAMPPLQLV